MREKAANLQEVGSWTADTGRSSHISASRFDVRWLVPEMVSGIDLTRLDVPRRLLTSCGII